MQHLDMTSENQELVKGMLKDLHGSEVDITSDDEYEELDHRAENQYWIVNNKLKMEESFAHGGTRDGACLEDVETIPVSALAVNKLMRYGFHKTRSKEALQVCDGDLGLALEYLLAECFCLNNTDDNVIMSDDMEEILQLRNDEMMALQAIYDEKFIERIPNRVWILKISLLYLDKIVQPKNDRKLKMASEDNRELCRFYQKGFCKFGKRCRLKHSQPEAKNTAENVSAIDVNMTDIEYEIEVRFPPCNCYPREPPFLAFSSTSSLLDKHVCLNITEHMMNEAKKMAEAHEPSHEPSVSLLDDETFLDGVLNEAPHEFSRSVHNASWFQQQARLESWEHIQGNRSTLNVSSAKDDSGVMEGDADAKLTKAAESMIKMGEREGKAEGKGGRVSEEKPVEVKRSTSKEEVKKQNPAEILKTNRKLVEDFKRKKNLGKYKTMQESRQKLPAWSQQDEILQVISQHQVVVISGMTGCGKTTQVPQFILDFYLNASDLHLCNILCTQPRRISAMAVAERVAEERADSLGRIVRYQIRLEKMQSSMTRLLFCTTGIVLRRLEGDATLDGVTHLIIDEVHERSEESDFLLMYLKDMLPNRPDLKVILMSATLNAQLFSDFFGGCAVVDIPGRTFPVDQYFLEDVLEFIGFVMEESSPYARPLKHMNAVQRGVAMEEEQYGGSDSGSTHKASDRVQDQNLSVKQLYLRYSDFHKATLKSMALMDHTKINFDLILELMSLLVTENHQELGFPESGAILVFMPGYAEIQTLYDMLLSSPVFGMRNKHRYKIIPLHSTLSSEDQHAVFSVLVSGRSALVAGDSNVHRINNVAVTVENQLIECLPVSGARYTNDQKMFRHQLKERLKEVGYKHLYLFLGSNDVFSTEHVFYRNVTEVCDMVHESCPETEIILCEIPPRGPNRRQSTSIPRPTLKLMQKWIETANSTLKEISCYTPYVRFLGRFMVTGHLTLDGLHLNTEGAEKCYRTIIEDNHTKERSTDVSCSGFLVEEDWPVLGDVKGINKEAQEDFRTPYAQIARSECVPRSTDAIKDRVKLSSPEVSSNQKIMRDQCGRRNGFGAKRRFEHGRRKWLKKFAKNVGLRSVRHPLDFIVVGLTDDVAVEMPAGKIGGVYSKSKELSTPRKQSTPEDRSLEESRKRIRRNPRWLPCPECKVKCSRDDFLLEHVIRRHVITKRPTPECTSSAPELRKLTPTGLANSFGMSDVSLPTSSDEGHRPTSPIIHGIPKDVNMSGIRLLLSNDVEQNPGPIVYCKWNHCSLPFSVVGEYDAHVIAHVGKDRCCMWEGCPGYDTDDLHRLDLHVLRHVYDNVDLFPSLDDWIAIQPGGIFNQKTNLHYCPKHIRSKLKLLFFDEDFEIPTKDYSAEDHGKYLECFYLHSPTKFDQDEKKYLAKRLSLGEDWSEFIGQDISAADTASTSFQSNVSNPRRCFYSVPCKTKYDFVQTSRPELSSSYFSGTLLKPQHSAKRKHESLVTSNVDEKEIPWFKFLLSNLSLCHKAISTQQEVLNKMHDIGMIESNSQKFITIEQETAKLGALDNCTAGTFACFVFRCLINDEEIFYIRYIESGCFSGFMQQKHLHILREKYSFTEDNSYVHCVYTIEDLEEMKTEANSKTVKRSRPDKIRNNAVSKTLSVNVTELKKLTACSETSDVKLESFIVNIWPYKPDTSAVRPETPFLEVSNPFCHSDVKHNLVDFRIHNLKLPTVTSLDIFEKDLPNDKLSLLQQSIKLNCLSSNIKREQSKHLYKRPGRYEANFLKSPCQTSSLRNHILVLYLTKDYKNMYSFLVSYFPDLGDHVTDNVELPISSDGSSAKKKKRNMRLKSVSVDKSFLEKQLKQKTSKVKPNSDTDPVPLFETFSFQLLDHGKLSIQYLDESGDVVCIMNDYSATDGSFRETEFVCTSKLVQETGNYFYCSCNTYSTLLDIQDTHTTNDEFLVLDSAGKNCVTCMHCKFLSQYVLPYLESDSANSKSKINTFIHDALQDNGKELVELVRRNNTRKFSILIKGELLPTSVHVTFNRRIGKHIVSCMNGQCLSKKGHKRKIETLEHAAVCKHLSVLRQHLEYWQDLKSPESPDSDVEDENHLFETESDDISVDPLQNSSEGKSNFNEQTGLWNFKCKSSHKPNGKGSESLRLNLQNRDLWNDNNLKRGKDGSLIGPNLFPEIPDNTCGCGAGWLKREDDENYNQNGRTIHESSRVLTIYTSLAPVKCQIHSRVCYSDTSPCKIIWDEGSLDSLHVLSNETAAGDEIGWEFVSLVMNSGCTFSSYCKLKNESYQIRDLRSKFMDPTVFLNWWFSWAANMKIDFRQSCDVCGFEPKRLCCDGTKVGVGFRHANFVEIENVNSDAPEHPTLHRRMTRCFLKNCEEISVAQTLKNREMLDYLARESLGELKPHEILTLEDRQSRILLLRQALPREYLLSFDKFFPFDTVSDRSESEHIAYASVQKMLATSASVTSLLPPRYCPELQRLLEPHIDDAAFNHLMNNMRFYAPELRDLIAESLKANNSDDGHIEDYIALLLRFLINESLNLPVTDPEPAVPQPDSYNPPKYGRAYYFNKFGLKLRNVRKFSIDKSSKFNDDHDDAAQDFEKCQKNFSKSHISARGTSSLFLWFCADHGHCYGFHMSYAEGRKDPSASLYSYLEKPPTDIFYDFACNLQEYCLNRESGYYKYVRFFHDIFHGFVHKCSCAFRSGRLQGFESVNSEICEQFNSFLQNMKKSARQMTQEHFCFYIQFFVHQWNIRKREAFQKKIKVALAGLQ